MKCFFIYITINRINQKQYIGSHFGYLNDAYLGSGVILKKAIKRYGKNSFSRSILEIVDNKEDIFVRELHWIKFYNADQSDMFYNVSSSPSGGFDLSNYTQKQKNKILKRKWRGIKKSRKIAATKSAQTRSTWTIDQVISNRARASVNALSWWRNLTQEERAKFIRMRTCKLQAAFKKNRKDISKKQSISQKHRWSLIPNEQRMKIGQKISNAQKGKIATNEQKIKISNTLKLYNSSLPQHIKESTSQKKSAAMAALKWYNNGKLNRRLPINHSLVASGEFKIGKRKFGL